MRKTIFVMILTAWAAGCSAAGDTSLVLKPTSQQIAKAAPAKNRICPVSHDSIGGMGEGVVVIWKGQAVTLCCPGCVNAFAKDPAKYVQEAKKEP